MPTEEKHPSLTPLRALALLRKVGDAGQTPNQWLIDDVKTALQHHVAHAITRKRKPPAKRARRNR